MNQETKDQIRAILCEVDGVEKDVKELRKWCIVNDTDFWTWRAEIFWEYNASTFIVIRELEKERPHLERKADIEDWEIIWNPLSLKHLMMYCNEKKKWYYVNYQNNWCISVSKWETVWFIIQLDITKELYEQEDEVLLDIINFLKG